MGTEVVAIIRMGEPNAYYHLKPISICEKVSCLHIIRPKPQGLCGKINNSKYYEIKTANKFLRFYHIYRQAIRLGRRPEVMAIVSFFAFPYGLIALLAGCRTGKPVHVGFVGDDWNIYCQKWYGRFLFRMIGKAAFITVTGSRMKEEMVAYGYNKAKIKLLPHAINLSNYKNPLPEERYYDCIFLGYFFHNKRVDLIILAIKELKSKYPGIKLCLVGDGPLRKKLEGLVKKNRLEKNIFFKGFQPHPEKYLCDARINIIASENEGFPFSIVEGIAAGAVPVASNVGSISDFIKHGENGLLFPKGNIEKLAENISCLLEDMAFYKKIRANLMNHRNEFKFENAAILWADWLRPFGE